MFYIEDDNFLQQPQKEHIDKLMSEIDFPVYFMDHGLTGDGNGQFVHSMLKRPEGCKPEERFNSLYFEVVQSTYRNLPYRASTFAKYSSVS